MNLLKNIDVVILCGGQGQRLRKVIGESQKVMARVFEEPFLNLLLRYLEKQGFSRVILCTGYKTKDMEEYYQKDFRSKLSLEFSQEEEPLGTGGALKKAQFLVQSNPFIVLNGDCFCPLEYSHFVKFYQDKNALASLVVEQVKENKDFGRVKLTADSRVSGFQEKMQGEGPCYVSTGVYCFDSKKIFSLMPASLKFSLEYDFFPRLLTHGFWGFVSDKEFIDIGTPERLEWAKTFLKKSHS